MREGGWKCVREVDRYEREECMREGRYIRESK